MFREAEFSIRTGREIREAQTLHLSSSKEKYLGSDVVDLPLVGRVEAEKLED